MVDCGLMLNYPVVPVAGGLGGLFDVPLDCCTNLIGLSLFSAVPFFPHLLVELTMLFGQVVLPCPVQLSHFSGALKISDGGFW